jgi:hypothetical protein
MFSNDFSQANIETSELSLLEEVASENSIRVLQRLFNDCLNQRPEFFGCNRKLLRKLFSSTVGLFIGCSFYNSAKSYGGDKKVLGYVYGASDVLAAAAQNAWLLEGVLQYIQTSGIYKNRSLKILFLALVLALCGSLPGTITSIKFNDSAPYLVAASFLGDIISNSFSFYQLFLPVFSRGLSKKSMRIEAMRGALAERLDKGLAMILNSHTQPKIFNEYQLNSPADPSFNLQQFINLLITKGAPHGQGWLSKNLRSDSQSASVIILTISMVSPLCIIPAMYNIVSSEVEEKIGSEVAGIALGILSCTPVYGLIFIVLRKLFGDILDKLSDMTERRFIKSYAQKNHPALFYPAWLLSILCAAFSFGTIATMVDMGMKNDSVKSVMLPFSIIFTILLKTFIFGDYIDKTALAYHAAKRPLDSEEGFIFLATAVKERITILPQEDLLQVIISLTLRDTLSAEADTPLSRAYASLCGHLPISSRSALRGISMSEISTHIPIPPSDARAYTEISNLVSTQSDEVLMNKPK